MAATDDLDALLREAIASEITPGCVALVWRAGMLRYHEAHGVLASHGVAPIERSLVTLDTRYDLASLTKVLATTTLAALAVARGELALDDRVPPMLAIAGDYRPTLRDLLEHASGLVAHREFFHPPWSLDPGQREAMIEAIRALPPVTAPRRAAIYSDLGFVLLGAWLEHSGGARLDELFVREIAEPLGFVGAIGFPGLEPLEPGTVAATEVYDASLHEGEAQHWYPIRAQIGQPTAEGLVHDDNCLVMAGVAGHAGLFGTARAVARIAQAWLERALPGLEPEPSAAIVRQFTTPSTVSNSTRRLGFDGPSPGPRSSTGGVLSPTAYGHLGYTGTSVWIDPPRAAIYVLLTNRVHPTRADTRILGLRRRFHTLASSV